MSGSSGAPCRPRERPTQSPCLMSSLRRTRRPAAQGRRWMPAPTLRMRCACSRPCAAGSRPPPPVLCAPSPPCSCHPPAIAARTLAGGRGAREGAPAVQRGRGCCVHDLPGEHPPHRPRVELPRRLLLRHAPALHPVVGAPCAGGGTGQGRAAAEPHALPCCRGRCEAGGGVGLPQVQAGVRHGALCLSLLVRQAAGPRLGTLERSTQVGGFGVGCSSL